MGRQYVRYFNRQYRRSGTHWEGRFKSCLVQEEHYILAVYRYIAMNPVRAGMVASPADYHWSSYASNALGKATALCQPHPSYLALATSEAMLVDIRSTIKSGMALGNERFKQEVEALTGRRQRKGKVGRPTKDRI